MAEEKSMESYLEKLKSINEKMTEDGIKMDDALRLYQEGVEVVREAEALLDSYAQKVANIEASAEEIS